MSAPPVLRVSALTMRFHGVTALDKVYLDVHAGQIVALIGPSGCGKSTLLRCLTWLEQPDDGFVEVAGKPLGRELMPGGVVRRQNRRQIDALRPQVGIVFQQFHLWPHMTALENVVRPQTVVLGRPRDEATRRGIELLTRLGLADRMDRHPHALSGGQKQRVAIARALLLDPRILILDDSTSSVDLTTEAALQKALDSLMQGRTSFVIAQRISTVMNADRIIVLDKGRIVAEGRHRELMEDSPIYAEIYNSQILTNEKEGAA